MIKRYKEASSVNSQNLSTYDNAWSVAEYTRETGLRLLETELVQKYFPSAPAVVLDLGCGAGRTTVGLKNMGFIPTGIDLSRTLLDAARHRYTDIDFKVMDATNLEFPDETFDAALFSFN